MARILVVEDDREQLFTRKLLLESSGHQVVEASTAGEALARMDADSPEAVVMDLRVPEVKDGAMLIERIAGRAPVIVLSGSGTSLLDGLPVFVALQKPCRTPVLLRAVQDAVASHDSRQSDDPRH